MHLRFLVFLIKTKSKCCNTNEKSNTNDCIHEGGSVKSQPPLIAKWRNGVKLQLPGRFDGDGKNVMCTFSFLHKMSYNLDFKQFILSKITIYLSHN